MSKRDTMIRALCKSLGDDYRVTTIDLERVIYRDFGNGFNVEISGVHTTSEKKKATLYLWFGDTMTECIIVKTVRDIPREQISEKVEELLKYSNWLIAQGYVSYDKLFRLKEIWKNNKSRRRSEEHDTQDFLWFGFQIK